MKPSQMIQQPRALHAKHTCFALNTGVPTSRNVVNVASAKLAGCSAAHLSTAPFISCTLIVCCCGFPLFCLFCLVIHCFNCSCVHRSGALLASNAARTSFTVNFLLPGNAAARRALSLSVHRRPPACTVREPCAPSALISSCCMPFGSRATVANIFQVHPTHTSAMHAPEMVRPLPPSSSLNLTHASPALVLPRICRMTCKNVLVSLIASGGLPVKRISLYARCLFGTLGSDSAGGRTCSSVEAQAVR